MNLLKIRLGGTERLVKYNGTNKGFLYLTYLDNYDSSTFTDTPKIGDPTVYTTYNSFIPSSVQRAYGDYQIPFFCNSTTREGNLWGGFLSFELPEIMSVEWIESYPAIGTSSFGMPGGISIVNSGKTTGLGIHGCLTNVIGCELSDNHNTLQPNWYSERNYYSSSSYTGYYRYYYPNNYYSLLNTNIHIAAVIDTTNKYAKLYYNGTLAITHNFASLSGVKYIKIDPGYFYTGYQAYRTQFCVRNGDCSTDGGTTYPVPDKPYWDFLKQRLR